MKRGHPDPGGEHSDALPSRAARKSAANEEPPALVDQVHGAQPPTEGGGAASVVQNQPHGQLLYPAADAVLPPAPVASPPKE